MMVLGGKSLTRAIAEAIAAGDVARVDELATRVWTLAPRVEGGDLGWSVLADWFGAHGRADLAARWRARADVAADGLLNAHRAGALASLRWIPVLAGMLIAVLLGTLLVGVRAAQARAAHRAALRARGGPRWWPRFRWHDALVVGLPLVVAIAIADHLRAATDFSGVWSSAAYDSLGSPDVIQRLERLPSNPARDEVLAYARAEQAAAARGTWSDAAPPSDPTLVEAFRDPRMDLDRAERTLHWSYGATTLIYYALEIDEPLEATLLLAALLAIGAVLATRWPRLGRATAATIPGGAPGFSIASGLVIGVVAAAVITLVGLSFEAFDPKDFAKYFGLADVWTYRSTGEPRAWAAFALAAVVGAQVWLVRRDRRRRP
jgi:hypothetical protein